MAEELRQKPRSSIRPGLILAVIVLLSGALAGAWFWAAGKLDETVSTFRETLAGEGKRLSCNGQDVKGFPFRIGLFCDSVSYADPAGAITVSGGPLRSAAQLYQPGHVVAEWDGPVDLAMPGIAPLTLEWGLLKASSNVALGGLKRVSLVASDLGIAANDGGLKSPLGTIGELELHARPLEEDPAAADLDFALIIGRWQLAGGMPGTSEPLALELDARLGQAMEWLRSGRDPLAELRRQGGAMEIRNFRIELASGGMLALRGPLSIGADGFVSGEVTLNADQMEKLVAFAASVFPPLGAMLNEPNSVLGLALGSGGSVSDLTITLDRGRAYIGLFEIGRIPRLRF